VKPTSQKLVLKLSSSYNYSGKYFRKTGVSLFKAELLHDSASLATNKAAFAVLFILLKYHNQKMLA